MVNFDGQEVSPVLLRKMTDSIAHRGPDGEGWYRDSGIGLGHRRLAILDLSPLGHQPMITRDQRFALTYNGEIYNHSEIRAELETLGHQFRSMSDSEVVLEAWAEWGRDSLHKFNGMFAFAIWDREKTELILARDRYGIKPLYYSVNAKNFVFGSEHRALAVHPAVDRSLDREAVFEYLTFQNIFTNRTTKTGVKTLPAGHVLTLNCKTTKFQLNQFWDFDFTESEQQQDIEEYEDELERLLRQAVSRQILADVEIGSYLSGGMDSGTLTALAASELPYIKTFTCGFDLSSASGIELGFDERQRAEAMSAVFKTEHYEMVLKSGDMERCMDIVARQIEEPRVGQSYPNYYVARLAGKFVKVVLSGAGGDELFGGYPWRYYSAAHGTNFATYIDNYYSYWHRLVDDKQLQALFAPVWNDVKHVSTREIFRSVFHEQKNDLKTPSDFVNHSLYFEAKTFLHGLLVVEDKLSMAHGLETRVPFLDNDLVDFALSCPARMKLRNLVPQERLNENDLKRKREAAINRTNDGKAILRSTMSRIIPRSITEGAKQGFSSPDASWFKGESIDFVKRQLGDPSNALYSVLDFKVAQELLNDHFEGRENRRLLIWSLLSLDSLLRENN